MTLDQIGLKHKTDKSSMTHHYLGNYEKYMGPMQDKELIILELGVAGGASIATWREYFPNAKVYGIDNNPDTMGENVFVGDQTDIGFLEKCLAVIGGEPNIIIDDASHEGWRTIESFKHLFPKLAAGGFYFVEDTATFYSTHYSGEFQSNRRSAVYNFFTDLAYHVDVAGRGMTGNTEYALAVENPNFDPVPEYSRILDSIHIHPSLWLFKRK